MSYGGSELTGALAAGVGAGGLTFLVNGMNVEGAGLVAGIAAVSCYLFAGPLKTIRFQDEVTTAAIGTGGAVAGLQMINGGGIDIMGIAAAAGGAYLAPSIILPMFK